jgi:hypothetical protein
VNKFSKYGGTFICQQCGSSVDEMRFWKDTFDLTWMCPSKHISKVNIYARGY